MKCAYCGLEVFRENMSGHLIDCDAYLKELKKLGWD